MIVFGDLGSVMVFGSLICSVCIADGDGDGDVSFSGVVGCRRAVGGGLVVGGGRRRLAVVGWRGHSPAEGAYCLFLLSILFL